MFISKAPNPIKTVSGFFELYFIKTCCSKGACGYQIIGLLKQIY
jgi:hypothetical protein